MIGKLSDPKVTIGLKRNKMSNRRGAGVAKGMVEETVREMEEQKENPKRLLGVCKDQLCNFTSEEMYEEVEGDWKIVYSTSSEGHPTRKINSNNPKRIPLCKLTCSRLPVSHLRVAKQQSFSGGNETKEGHEM